MKFFFRSLIVLFTLAIAAAASGYGYLHWWFHHEATLTNLPNGAEPTLFEVPRGSHSRRVAQQLAQSGYITSAKRLDYALRLFQRGSGVKAGVYELRAGESLAEFWQRLNTGDQYLFAITFVEGTQFSQWQQILAAHPYIRQGVAESDPAALMTQLGSDFEHPEGLLFPDTYRFYAYTSDLQILRQSYQRMQRVIDDLWPQRDRSVPVTTWYEALILASIVEKETGAAHERELVASVFVNRLHKGMRLQSDPTIIYGLGERYRGVIYRSDIQEHTPYNTYRIDRLPPTPIAMPGRAAIAATLMPAESDYYYFVSRNDGTHVFSRTLEEHNRAVFRYQRNR